VEPAVIEQFHFLRPWWLLALIPLAAVTWLLIRGRYDSGNWRTVVDPRLLPHVLSGANQQARGSIRWMFAAVAGLAIIALAGPTWETGDHRARRADLGKAAASGF
jgi:Ca-activated chloride channel family protein